MFKYFWKHCSNTPLYAVLPAFDDVKEALTKLKEKGFRLFAFSNGKKEAVEKLLSHAGVRELFLDVVSVDDIKTYFTSNRRRRNKTCR